MPRLPPVTRATRPLIPRSMLSSSFCLRYDWTSRAGAAPVRHVPAHEVEGQSQRLVGARRVPFLAVVAVEAVVSREQMRFYLWVVAADGVAVCLRDARVHGAEVKEHRHAWLLMRERNRL